MKVGDLVQFRGSYQKQGLRSSMLSQAWIGLIIQDIPGTADFKIVKWWHNGEERPHQLHEGKNLKLLTAKKT